MEKRKRRRHIRCVIKKAVLSVHNILKEYFVIYSLILIYIFLNIIKFQLLPFIHIVNTNLAISLLSIIIGSLSSILGIIVAIQLVAFELVRKTFSSYAFSSFFKQREIKLLFSLFILTITFSTISLIRIQDPICITDNNVIPFILLLFLTSILILYPSSKKILTSTKHKNKINEIINSIDYSTLSLFRDFDRNIPAVYYLQAMENNPIYVLSDVAVRTILEEDRINAQVLLIQTTKKLFNLLDTPYPNNNSRSLIEAFLVLYRNVGEEAIKQKQKSTILTLLSVLRDIHMFCAEHKYKWSNHIELDDLISDTIISLIRNNLDELARYGIRYIEDVVIKHLFNNLPDEKDIWSLHPWKSVKDKEIDHSKSTHWNHFSTGYSRIIYHIAEVLFEQNKLNLIGSITSYYENIFEKVMNSELGDLMKMRIIKDCCMRTNWIIIKYVKSPSFQDQYLPINYSCLIDSALDNMKEYSRIPLLYYSNLLLGLAKIGKLPVDAINELGTPGRHAIDHLNSQSIYHEAVIFILNSFQEIGRVLIDNNNENVPTIYKELIGQIESLGNWLDKEKLVVPDLNQKIEEVLKDLKSVHIIKNDKKDIVLNWPNIDNK